MNNYPQTNCNKTNNTLRCSFIKLKKKESEVVSFFSSTLTPCLFKKLLIKNGVNIEENNKFNGCY